jgi:hypothetical protein
MAWTQLTNIKGPAGAAGPQGAGGAQGVQGVAGPAGVDGKAVQVAGQVATYALLPNNLTSADAGKGYLVEADGDLYVWSGTAFPADGSGTDFRGPVGAAGPQGVPGATGAQGTAGAQGTDGAAGATGATGVRGSKWYTGSGAPGTIAGSMAGDHYQDLNNGDVYSLS